MERPFIRLEGRTLCFDMFTLFDNFYRVLQRVIFRLEPEYKRTWNERQKAVSEELAVHLRFAGYCPGLVFIGRFSIAGGRRQGNTNGSKQMAPLFMTIICSLLR